MKRPRQRSMQNDPTRRRSSKLFWIGLNLLLFGSGPLITICIAASLGLTADPNPHATLPSLLALLTFWPAVGLIISGIISSAHHRHEARS